LIIENGPTWGIKGSEADPFIARLLRRFSEEYGLRSVQAGVGQDILGLARRIRPDVIILETELPGYMRGWQAVRALRADPELCAIPVIVCSWLPESQCRALAGEVAGYLRRSQTSTIMDFCLR
jgi:CheY-like chemotaxis protein